LHLLCVDSAAMLPRLGLVSRALTRPFVRSFSVSFSLRDALVIAEHDNKTLNAATLHAITAASQLGGQVDVLVAGKGAKPVADAAAKASGVRKVILVDAAHLEHPVAEQLSQVIATQHANGKYTHVVAAATSVGKNVLPRFAATLNVQPISEVQKVKSSDTFVRPIYAGNALATVQSKDAVKVLTVRATAFAKAALTDKAAPVESLAAPAPVSGKSEFQSQDLNVSSRPELSSADRVVSGGRAVKSAEGFKVIYQLADEMKAAVGASRAAVDAGYAPNDLQVGQTGKIVAPTLYVAVGISGAIQHLAGMKDSKVIVAINTDGDAPIFQVADYGLVQDLFTAIPEIAAEIKAKK